MTFGSNVRAELAEMKNAKQDYLNEYSPVVTGLTFFRVDDRPGFLTPWWENTDYGVNMGPHRAGQDLLTKVALNLFMMGVNIVKLFGIPCTDAEPYESSKTERWVASAIGCVYFPVEFVVDLALDLAAMITRTLASIGLGIGMGCEKMVHVFAPN